ncbi:hypothetical protein TEA_019667 [Camellia sinensis var. sinensis]|uniref:Uncharacterized protein n=1 Tax=Camellia sinensis var. sinensis TaxID=542762 RepID=A0A4S4EBX7_CAMSN|nr:hypothetical protein TEA_019667 [Camellia sinensis var. sinensis]
MRGGICHRLLSNSLLKQFPKGIEAHIGSVSDIAFASISEQISIVIGGDDKTIKVWDVVTGANLFTFKGHETPVFCVCPHVRGNFHLDITKDHFLAAGDDYVIKFWEMDSEDLLATSDARGDLPLSGFETPYICFNKEGTLLAASARNKRIKILGTLNGIQSLQAHEMPVSIIATKNGDRRSLEDVPKTIEVVKPIKALKIKEISELAQLQFLLLPGSIKMAKVTTKNSPQLWHPISRTLMTNDLTGVRTEEAKPCFALSKNDSYLISTSGGQVSLFNIATFKTMAIFIFAPPVPMYVAFYPHDNNIIAIGMDDSTVLIYDTRANEIIVWQCNKSISKKSSLLQLPTGRSTKKLSEIEVQFHQDQIHFLVVHELKLAVHVIYPLVVATNPNEPNQFALGLTDGTVCVYELLESDGEWGEKSQCNNSTTLPAIESSSNQHQCATKQRNQLS